MPTAFYISLTALERDACDAMPAFFRNVSPSQAHMREAWEFFVTTPHLEQRGVAKRWILEHLRDVEYILQPIEWDRFPHATRMLQQRWGVDVRSIDARVPVHAGHVTTQAERQAMRETLDRLAELRRPGAHGEAN